MHKRQKKVASDSLGLTVRVPRQAALFGALFGCLRLLRLQVGRLGLALGGARIEDAHRAFAVACARGLLHQVQVAPVPPRDQSHSRQGGQEGGAGDGPEDPADVTIVLQLGESIRPDGRAHLARGGADAEACSLEGRWKDDRRDAHRRHAGQTLESQLDDVQRVEEDHVLLMDVHVEDGKTEIDDRTARKTQELHPLHLHVRRQKGRDRQSRDHQEPAQGHSHDAVLDGSAVGMENSGVVLLQAVLDDVVQEPAECSTEQWHRERLERPHGRNTRLFTLLVRLLELVAVLGRQNAKHKAQRREGCADPEGAPPHGIVRKAGAQEDVDDDWAEQLAKARSEQVEQAHIAAAVVAVLCVLGAVTRCEGILPAHADASDYAAHHEKRLARSQGTSHGTDQTQQGSGNHAHAASDDI
mmetsp:Transcript_92140/g.264096  ORF Transcript_92140/g.264096 Transcript_92140/m.264096 type:complete len:413 (-) Transcript_92140:292-1530(-)